MTSARKHKLQLKALKPRNPLVAPARARKAGQHMTTGKALRQQGKRELRKEWAQGD